MTIDRYMPVQGARSEARSEVTSRRLLGVVVGDMLLYLHSSRPSYDQLTLHDRIGLIRDIVPPTLYEVCSIRRDFVNLLN